MTIEHYDPDKNQWETGEEKTSKEKAEGIYAQVGARFRIDWKEGVPHVHFDTVPDDISDSDVKKAVKENT